MWTFLIVFFATVIGGLILYIPEFKRLWKNSMETESRAAAERVLADRKRVYSRESPLEPAQIEDFAFRGYEFYDRRQAELERSGCTLLGDFMLGQAASTRPGVRTFFRVLRSSDGQTLCAIIDATPSTLGMSGWMKVHFYLDGTHKRYLKGIILRTELGDGRFIITATGGDFVEEELPPEISKEIVSRATPMAELLTRHRDRVAGAVSQRPTTIVPVETVDDFGASYLRHQRTMRAFREKVGFAFTEKEQQDFAGTKASFNQGMAHSMLDAMRSLEKDGRKRAGA
jgi:hypothetical protein